MAKISLRREWRGFPEAGGAGPPRARCRGRGRGTCAPFSLAPHPEEPLAPARWRRRPAAFRRDGGGGAAAAAGAGAGAGAGRWWAGDVTVPVGTVLLAGPVALYPLRCGAFPAYLLAALRARPRARAGRGILTYFAPSEHRQWKSGTSVRDKQRGTRLHLRRHGFVLYPDPSLCHKCRCSGSAGVLGCALELPQHRLTVPCDRAWAFVGQKWKYALKGHPAEGLRVKPSSPVH